MDIHVKYTCIMRLKLLCKGVESCHMASPFRTKNFISYYLDTVDVQYAYITRPIVQLHHEIQAFVRGTLCDVYILSGISLCNGQPLACS